MRGYSVPPESCCSCVMWSREEPSPLRPASSMGFWAGKVRTLYFGAVFYIAVYQKRWLRLKLNVRKDPCPTMNRSKAHRKWSSVPTPSVHHGDHSSPMHKPSLSHNHPRKSQSECTSVGGNVNQSSYCENNVQSSKQLKIELPCDPVLPILCISWGKMMAASLHPVFTSTPFSQEME